jgi:4,5-DOPA dioxygenase extradiol
MTKLPVLFLGHGSPMNALEDNEFTRGLRRLGERLRQLAPPLKIRSILGISAHWQTEGSWVLPEERPRTIHDFYGFPKELYTLEYPAPGSPELAGLIQRTVGSRAVRPDPGLWGFDHGLWSVLRHLFPEADVPVTQLSLDLLSPASEHLALGGELRPLRDQGVLLVASGNIVHNLRELRWEPEAPSEDWAIAFQAWVRERLERRELAPLVHDRFEEAPGGRLSVPTPDHFLPLLYALGASEASDPLRIEHEWIQNGSISMLSLSFGLDSLDGLAPPSL